MGSQSTRARRLGIIGRRLAPVAASLLASAVVCAPASASPTIVVSGDTVLATSLPTWGQATITATRPDALTGAPVVIGLYSGVGNPLGPFSVNETTPTPLNPAGDCWQKGALTRALTPDLQPGDTVMLTQAGLFGNASSSNTGVNVKAADANIPPGPISGCSAIAPWARNAITSGPSAVTDGPITISGVAQPLATGVSVSATDGTHSTPPVTATPASDGSWTVTIPASQLAALANRTLTVTPVIAVPDVSTGAQAHIAGVGMTLTKSAPASGTTPGHAGGTGAKPTGGTRPIQPGASGRPGVHARVSGLRVPATLTLARARRNGIHASFVLPAGAKVVRAELLQRRNRLFAATIPARKPGSRQAVALRSNRLSHLLRTGDCTVVVQVGTGRSGLGPMTTRTVRVR